MLRWAWERSAAGYRASNLLKSLLDSCSGCGVPFLFTNSEVAVSSMEQIHIKCTLGVTKKNPGSPEESKTDATPVSLTLLMKEKGSAEENSNAFLPQERGYKGNKHHASTHMFLLRQCMVFRVNTYCNVLVLTIKITKSTPLTHIRY